MKQVTTKKLKAQRSRRHRILSRRCRTLLMPPVNLEPRIRSVRSSVNHLGTADIFIACNVKKTHVGIHFSSQGSLPPPYSSTASSKTNGSPSSPISTMTSESSASSVSKQRQSWSDVNSQSPPPAGETAVVCQVQVHLHQAPQEAAEDDREEEEEDRPLENSVLQNFSKSSGPKEESSTADQQGDVVAAPDNSKPSVCLIDRSNFRFCS